MDVTDEDAQMDLDLYIGNFDQKSINFRRTRPGKTERQPKSIIYIRYHGKSEETKNKANEVTLALRSAILGDRKIITF